MYSEIGAELHCHSKHSKGGKIELEVVAKPRDIVRKAKGAGLGAIALTDHDSVRGWKEAASEARKQGIVFIPGIEVSTAKGHIVGLGVSEAVKPGLSVEETVERIREQGGLAVAAHPFDVRGKGVKGEMAKADAIEVFDSLALDRVSNWVCLKRAAGLGKPLVAGSDAHSLDMIGSSVNSVRAGDLDSLLKELRAGRVRFETRYINLSNILSWTNERLEASKDQMMEYFSRYSAPKARLSAWTYNKFLRSPESWTWLTMARVGLAFTTVYSGFRAIRYI